MDSFKRAGNWSAKLRNLGAVIVFALCFVAAGCVELGPEIVIIAQPASGYAPLQVLLEAHLVDDASNADPMTYAWSFGDGTSAAGKSIEHTFHGKGTIQVLLAATDAQGRQVTASHSIQLLNRLPEARFAIQPMQPPILLPIQFDASDSRDLDGEIVLYHWDFGDGSTAEGQVVWHTFVAPHSTYEVVLSVTDDSGDVNQLTRFIQPIGCDH